MFHRHMTKEQSFEFAQRKAQETGSDYRVIELGDDYFAIGTMKKIDFFYPNSLGWNFRYQY